MYLQQHLTLINNIMQGVIKQNKNYDYSSSLFVTFL